MVEKFKPFTDNSVLNVLSNDVHIVRRLFWFAVFIFGSGYSMNMIARNIQRYYQARVFKLGIDYKSLPALR